MAKMTKKQQKAVKAIVDSYEVTGSGDYRAVEALLREEAIAPTNALVWKIVNLANKAQVEYDLDFLD